MTTIESEAWVRRYHPAPDAPTRLVCFPHAGGSASFYFPVAAALSPAVDVLALQYPGRQDRRGDALITDIPTFAERIADALVPWMEGPVAFFGHSMGAVLAFEVARRMERQGGAGPVRLFVSGRRAPSRHRPDTVHTLDQDGVIAALRALSGTDDRVFDDPELLGVVMPALRSDYRAVERHRGDPRATVSAPITALVGDDDHTTSIEEAGAWRGSTTGEFDLHVFPGGHFYLGAEQSAVLRLVSARLTAGTAGQSSAPGELRPEH